MTRTLLSRRSAMPTTFPSLGREFDTLNASFRRMFDNPFALANDLLAGTPQPLGWTPPVDIAETTDTLVFTLELPGMDPKDVHVTLDKDVLIVRGEKLEEKVDKPDERTFHLFERTYGTFQRAFMLPRTVDADTIDATFVHGVLTITLKKTKEAKLAGREIKVNIG